jgi:hypothetical protein
MLFWHQLSDDRQFRRHGRGIGRVPWLLVALVQRKPVPRAMAVSISVLSSEG